MNARCFWVSGERDPILFPTLKKGPSFVEFWTRSGKKVRAEWGDSQPSATSVLSVSSVVERFSLVLTKRNPITDHRKTEQRPTLR